MAICFISQTANALKSANGRIQDNVTGRTLNVLMYPKPAPFSNLPADEEEMLKQALNTRYNPQMRTLNLSEFHADSGWAFVKFVSNCTVLACSFSNKREQTHSAVAQRRDDVHCPTGAPVLQRRADHPRLAQRPCESRLARQSRLRHARCSSAGFKSECGK